MWILNFASLILGLIAWILPIINLVKIKNHDNNNWATLSAMSTSACAISLSCQIFYNNYLVKIADWTALMDTAGAVNFVSAVLLVVTIILNIVTLIVYQKGNSK
ncbi:MAG: hypothetical protein E6929_13215 [Clostridium sp.]|nr:hypothetical protein [Clostridium sp.]